MKKITVKGKEFEVRVSEKNIITEIWSSGNDGTYQYKGLYVYSKKYNCWLNMLSCTIGQFRYIISKKDYKIL